MEQTQKIITKQKRTHWILGKSPSTQKPANNKEEPLLKKGIRNKLEEKVRQQTDELKVRSRQLKNGVDREKLAEEQIHIQTKAMESTLDGIFIIDAKKPNFPIIYANPSFYSLTGYTKNEAIGESYLLLYGSDADSRVVEEIKQTMRRGKSFHGGDVH